GSRTEQEAGRMSQRRKRTRRTNEGAPHPKKDDPGTEVAVVCAFGDWNAILGHEVPLDGKGGAAHVKAVDRAEGALDEPCRTVRKAVRRVRTPRRSDSTRCAQRDSSRV